jgi:hypothetical protein
MFGSKLMKGEEIFKTVQHVWKEKRNLPSIARAYCHHHQIACAILHHKGGNQYITERKGMHFGIRQCYMESADGEGVELVPTPTIEGEDEEDDFSSSKTLKYASPQIQLFSHVNLSTEMKELLREFMDHEKMDDSLTTTWEKVNQEDFGDIIDDAGNDTDDHDETCSDCIGNTQSSQVFVVGEFGG